MRIYPINQSPIMFRGNQNSNIKRYCEPRTGAYYYYDATQIEKTKSKNNIFNILFNKVSSMSKGISDTFTHTNNDAEDILWL